MTINTLDNCYEYVQLSIINEGSLQMWIGNSFCNAALSGNWCVLRDFTSGPVTVKSEIENAGVTMFSITCNTNFKETFQFYTNLFSIICSVLAFALIANCILLTCVHNTIVCTTKTFRKSRREVSEGLVRTNCSPPRYRKQDTYDSI